jgi:hypothetical protein
MLYKFIKLQKVNDGKHKYQATFLDLKTNRQKTIKFGAYGYEDYTIHKDEKRKENYIKRHSKDNLNDPIGKGTLSMFILWNKTNIEDSLKDYLNRFKKVIE